MNKKQIEHAIVQIDGILRVMHSSKLVQAVVTAQMFGDFEVALIALNEAAERRAGCYQPCRDAERSDYEAAIAEIELDVKPFRPYTTAHLDLAVAALREMQDRSVGCFHCNGCERKEGVAHTPDGFIAFYGYEREEPDGRVKRYKSTDVVKFCPNCGRKIEGGIQ